VKHGREAGASDIKKGITSSKNPRLILHDSQGFSHGSGDIFNTVKEFIQTHSRMPNLTDFTQFGSVVSLAHFVLGY
jgi:hypothetical protein